VTTTYQEPNALGRATLQPSRAKSAVRTAIHLLSYYFILKRRRAAQTRVAGFRLIVPPTVFHPRYFLTSAFFAQFVSKLDLSGKRIADVGTGSGILALAAAQAGGATVLALDINPNAVQAAAENAYANGFGGSISAVGSNLLSAAPSRSPHATNGKLQARFWRAGLSYMGSLCCWPMVWLARRKSPARWRTDFCRVCSTDWRPNYRPCRLGLGSVPKVRLPNPLRQV
jgi:SAM-dependent methyltransferase